jgi:uncharacterized phage protein (TIGR01671 family)
MREIKFRAWHHGGGDPRIMGYMNHSEPFPLIFWKQVHEEVLGVELMQFTGLTDKKGKEIYEGDILQWPADKDIAVVQYCIAYSAFRLINEKTFCDASIILNIGNKGMAAVIGNIYENPELVELIF